MAGPRKRNVRGLVLGRYSVEQIEERVAGEPNEDAALNALLPTTWIDIDTPGPAHIRVHVLTRGHKSRGGESQVRLSIEAPREVQIMRGDAKVRRRIPQGVVLGKFDPSP